ncbi:MAG: hypothetical protein HOD43_11750 [Candidatus Marinimicrobia bacterium]|nr:hypothetical protein [Candidatus Neomarinimicrobiota bacterium]MBT3825018.1 hypothetical protein [Candidatus Neomarinimicrobiota bacterium]MBT4132470.1 hypothetical protein [Candidatus Neomarinimicrobiota bacterium]MBT4296463.1 hypothetical protein [Candidatus Neomarinimicrobiota bacterium]MBT4419626.1 hypothetical protein [Candidatus Neomarinimicrobiota bacterium]
MSFYNRKSIYIRKSSLERLERGYSGLSDKAFDEFERLREHLEKDFYIHGDIPTGHFEIFTGKCAGNYVTHIVDTPVYRDNGKPLKLKIMTGVETDEIYITVVES